MPEPQRPAPPRRVLVTGAAGFIGAALTRELLLAGSEVLGLDDLSAGWRERLPRSPAFEFLEADASEPGLLRGLLARGDFDLLVHLAARVGVRSVLRDPEGCRASNLRGVREILAGVAGLPRERRPRVLAASSSEVYADSRAALREGDATRPTSGAGRWAYAASKLRAEQLLDDAALWPLSRGPVHLRFFNVVGPGQDADSGMVLPTFVERALAGDSLPVHGDGAQVRTFAHVDQVARALVQLVEHPALPAGVLNVGGGARTSIARLAELVGSRARAGSALRFTDPRSRCANFEDVSFREPDLARLAALGVCLPSMSLEEIVDDSLARHALLRRPAAGAARAASSSCVSPAS